MRRVRWLVTMLVVAVLMLQNAPAADAGRRVGFEWHMPWKYADQLKSVEVWLIQDKDGRARVEKLESSVEQLFTTIGAESRLMVHDGQANSPAVVVRTSEFNVRDHGESTALLLVSHLKTDPKPRLLLFSPETALKADVPIASIASKQTISFVESGTRTESFIFKDAVSTPIDKGNVALVYQPPSGEKVSLWRATTNEKGEALVVFRGCRPNLTAIERSKWPAMFNRIHWEFAHPELPKQFTREVGLADQLPPANTGFVDEQRLSGQPTEGGGEFLVLLAVPAPENRDAWRKTVEGHVFTLKRQKLEPFAGAVVKNVWGAERQVLTDAKGHFAIHPVSESKNQLRIEAPGYAVANVGIKPGDKDIEALLQTGMTVTLILKDHEQKPLANRSYQLIKHNLRLGVVTTDRNGEAVVEHLVPDSYLLLGAREQYFKLEEGETRKTIQEPAPAATKTVDATIVDRKTGKPVAGAMLKPGTSAEADVKPLAISDRDGKLRCAGYEGSSVLTAPGYAQMPVPPGELMKGTPVIKLNPAAPFVISVRDSSGKPLDFTATANFEIHGSQNLKLREGPVYWLNARSQSPGEARFVVPLDYPFEILIHLPQSGGDGRSEPYDYPVPGLQRVTDSGKPARLDVRLPPLVPFEIQIAPEVWDARLDDRVLAQVRHPRIGSPWPYRRVSGMDPRTKILKSEAWAETPIQIELGIRRDGPQGGLYNMYRSNESFTLEPLKPGEAPRRIMIPITREKLHAGGFMP